MTRSIVFSEGEWYHCFSRGVDKRMVYEDEQDYRRFIELLYLANDTEPIHITSLKKKDKAKIFSAERARPLVSIGAFALMPNHYHLLLKPSVPDGLSKFMQKLGTAYTMYFNTKHKRVGNLFVKPFRARHVEDDRYLQHVIHYIHLNPAELYEQQWKQGRVKDIKELSTRLKDYPYSSLRIHEFRTCLGNEIINGEIYDAISPYSFSNMLEEARLYYSENTDLEW